MRFMFIIKSADTSPPTPELLDAMGKLAEQEIKAGRMLDTGGLAPLQVSSQVTLTAGKIDVIDGPFVEAKEMIGGYAIFEMQSQEEAIAGAVNFLQLHKDHQPGWDGTCEIRAIFSGDEPDATCNVASPALA